MNKKRVENGTPPKQHANIKSLGVKMPNKIHGVSNISPAHANI